VEGLLELAESGIDSADEVEGLAVEGSRGLGRQVMQEWAERQAQEKSQAVREADADVSSKGKKTLLDNDVRGDSARGGNLRFATGCSPTL
jgi:hypothetical protein